jgi:hypothetical protein
MIKKGSIGTTLTWIPALIAIFFMSLFFVLIVGGMAVRKIPSSGLNTILLEEGLSYNEQSRIFASFVNLNEEGIKLEDYFFSSEGKGFLKTSFESFIAIKRYGFSKECSFIEWESNLIGSKPDKDFISTEILFKNGKEVKVKFYFGKC